MIEANSKHSVIIVGGGAAGLAAAIHLGTLLHTHNFSNQITVIDAAPVLGAKILVSGGGRCNITHKSIRVKDYHGATPFIRQVFKRYGLKKTLAWLNTLGISLKEEPTGKLFPVSNQAKTVVNAFIQKCYALNIQIVSRTRVTSILKASDGFRLQSEGSDGIKDWYCRTLILSTGGKSLPKTGSTGQGWDLAQNLGHTVTDTFPALVPLKLSETFFHAALKGISLNASLSCYSLGQKLDERDGELLWTHFGISGPLAMDASRFITSTKAEVEVKCNFTSIHPEQIDQWLMEQGQTHPKLSIKKGLKVLPEALPERLILELIKHVGIPPEKVMSQLSKSERRSLGKALTQLTLPILGSRGWQAAEVTAGGIPLSEVDAKTMRSRLENDLYLIGEILDCDGRIGGFNFQWAWSTAAIAAQDILSQLTQTQSH